jgi:DNA ligase-1
MKYLRLAQLYEKLESTSKRLEKTALVGEFLKETKGYDLIYLIQGKIFPNWDKRKIGVASRLLLKCLSLATGNSTDTIEKKWKDLGDLGLVAEQLTGKKKQATLFSQDISIRKVRSNLIKLAQLEGTGTVDKKVQLIAELLTSAQPIEAKYIIRTVIGDMRTGLGEGVMRDSLAWAFFSDDLELTYDAKKNSLVFASDRTEYDAIVNEIQDAFNLTNDFVEVASVLKEKGRKGLASLTLTPGRPIKVMLYQKAKDFEDALKTVGTPAVCEYKYDGFRLQIHKSKDGVILFTRRLEDVTAQFPDVVSLIEQHVKADSFILDAEAVGVDAKSRKYLPFQDISQIKRKYNIEQLAKKFPVEVAVFDILYLDGQNLIKSPYEDRRRALKGVLKSSGRIKLIEQLITSTVKEAEKYYKESLAMGNEGIMVKNLQGIYKPGSRVGYGVKVKPVMETLDLVIVGGEYGEGKRSKWLASFIVACRDPDSGDLKEIGRVGTGIKEKDEEGTSFNILTELLKPSIISEKGKIVRVKPEIVIEVNYEEIQKSPKYSSGYALRFPRFVRLREDRDVEDVSDLSLVQGLYEKQRGRS